MLKSEKMTITIAINMIQEARRLALTGEYGEQDVEYEDVKVTNSRFINGANTYAMAGITSIKLREKNLA